MTWEWETRNLPCGCGSGLCPEGQRLYTAMRELGRRDSDDDNLTEYKAARQAFIDHGVPLEIYSNADLHYDRPCGCFCHQCAEARRINGIGGLIDRVRFSEAMAAGDYREWYEVIALNDAHYGHLPEHEVPYA